MAITEGPPRYQRSGPSRVRTTPPLAAALRHRAAAPVLVGLLAFAISAIGIGIPSVWYDEAATITATTRSWPQLWAMLGNVDAVHGAYYVLMHLVVDAVGYSPLALRMPSALAVGATAALVVVLGRQLGGARVGLIAGLVFSVLPRVTWMGGEGRSYALTAFFAALLTIAMLRSQSGSRRHWIVYGALALLACAVFIYLALVVLAHGITLLWKTLRGREGSLADLRRWAIVTGGAGLVGLPLALEIVSQDGQVAWIARAGSDTVHDVLVTQWFEGSLPLAVLAWGLVVVGVVRQLHTPRPGVLATLIPALALPTLALLAVGLVREPLYLPRYLSLGTPFIALAVAVGLASIRWRGAAVVGVALVALLALPQAVAQRLPEAKENSSWAQVAQFIAAERAADGPGSVTAVIYGNLQRHPSATSRVMAYAYPGAFADAVDVTLRTPAAQTAQLWETRAPIAASTERLLGADVAYLVTSTARDVRSETIAALAPLGWRVTETRDFTAVHVLRFERAP